MCLLAMLWRMIDDAPLVVAANREEAYARGGLAPRVQGTGVKFVAGTDPVAGGTWLGVNEHGLLIAITNGSSGDVPVAPRSRGLLARDLLACPDVRSASKAAVVAFATKQYAGCNLVLADAERLEIAHHADWLRIHPLPPGLYVLTNGNVNNAADERIDFALQWLSERKLWTVDAAVAALKRLCALNGRDGLPPITLRKKGRGTVSSSVIVLRTPLSASWWWHSQGAPDETPYQDFSGLLQQLG